MCVTNDKLDDRKLLSNSEMFCINLQTQFDFKNGLAFDVVQLYTTLERLNKN